MTIEPLNKDIYNKALALGIDRIILSFAGGSDEGYLNVGVEPWDRNKSAECNELSAEIENWAWEVYSYSGAGDGSDYGDDITYDLKNKRVSSSEWFTARQESEAEEGDLTVDDSDQE